MWNSDGSYTIELAPGSRFNEVRLSGALLAQKSDGEIKEMLRRLYAGMHQRRDEQNRGT